MRFFGLKTCDTCRKALSELRSAGISPQVTDVRVDGLSPQDIAAIVQVFGTRAVNRSSATWRGLTDTEKAADPADLLAAHPTVMKRPVIERDGSWFLGWDGAVQTVLLG